VALVRSGNVGTYADTDGSLDDANELSTVFGLQGNVKAVGAVNFCGGLFNTSIIGCGQLPGTSFITERFTANQEGILWAHEFGHNQGLPHRTDSTNNLMFPSIGTNRRHVNQEECDAFRGQGGLIAEAVLEPRTAANQGVPLDPMMAEESDPMMAEEPAATMAGQPDPMMAEELDPMMIAEDLDPMMAEESDAMMAEELDPMMAEESDAMMAAGRLPVEEFVTQIFIQGLPLDEAAQYGEEDVEPLLDILSDPSMVRYHENAALTLGMIGDERAVDPLIEYVQRGPAGGEAAATAEDPPHAAYQGRVGAIVGLGYLANLTGSERAVEFLIQQSNPAAWSEETLDQLPSREAGAAEPREDLSKYAIISLGFSGSEEANEHLRSLGSEGARASTSGFLSENRNEIAQSLRIFEEVSEIGLVDYYARPR
jgi:hypothetical protein